MCIGLPMQIITTDRAENVDVDSYFPGVTQANNS